MASRGVHDRRATKGSGVSMSMESLSNVVATKSRGQDVQEGGEHYYVQAPARIIGEALVTLLCRVVQYVGVSDEAFDECLEMLIPVAEKRDDVRKVLEERNADAVWLALWMRGRDREARITDEAKEIRRPVGKKQWRFEFAEVA